MATGSADDAPTPPLRAWRVRDSGLVPAPPRFRRLPGALRHHQGHGPAWPDEVLLVVEGTDLVVDGVGRWGLADVRVSRHQPGPPVTFVVEVPEGSHLLAAAAGPATERFLDALA